MLLTVFSTWVHAAPIAAQAKASETADLLCNDIMKALSADNYVAATAHFDPAMKASFSPERIGSIWQRVSEANGRLISWGVRQRSTADCRETIVAPLKFDHKSNLAAFISVNPNGEVSGLYFAPTPLSPISATPATSSPPAVARDFDSIDVNVGSLEQCGTITIPTTGSGPWPGVVLVGSADKDGTAGAKHFFKDIAEGLSSRGIVVLRYDKRWYDALDKRDRQDLTVEKDYIDDGAAAVNLLRARGEAAKDRIFVAGYDLAAAITPDVAREVAPVQGLILLAPPFPGRKVGASEVRGRHYLGWDSQPQLHKFERKARELDSHQLPAAENFGWYPASYWYDLVGRNEVTVARQLGIPILILHGDHDFMIIDIEHWQEGLKGVPHVRVETIPALNQMLLAGIAKPRAEHYDPGHVDQQVINAMAAFIEKPLANRTATAGY